jgi:hypothetical protein
MHTAKVMLWANKVTGNTQIDSKIQRFQRSRLHSQCQGDVPRVPGPPQVTDPLTATRHFA